jgi:hypothetical protein
MEKRMQDLRDQLNAAEQRARSLKTKKAQIKAWDKVREIRREILTKHLYPELAKYRTHSVKGIVKRFHPGDDHYLVETKEYGTMWLSPCADVLTKSWYDHTCCIEYVEGQIIVIECELEINHDKLQIFVQPGHVTGGFVNEVQYAELCKQDDLAFFKYPNSNGVTGLFARPKAVSNE